MTEALDVLLYKARNYRLIRRRYSLLLRENERKMQLSVREFMDYMTKKLKAGLPRMRGKTATQKAKSITDWEEIRERGREILKPALFEVLNSGATTAYTQKLRKQERFDPIGIEAINWTNAHSAETVVEITQETMHAIRDTIVTGINAGKSMPTIARELRPIVGLNTQYAGAVSNYHTSLIAEGVAASKAAAKAETYAGRLHRRRTMTIARTESAFALSEGQRQGYSQMGIKHLERIEDPDCCDICAEYHGKIYTIADAEGVLPEHPNCEGTFIAATGEVPVSPPEIPEIAPGIPGMPSEWKPATTMDGAREFGLKNLVQAKGEVYYGKEVCLQGANSINANLYKLTKKYKKKPDYVGTPEGYKKWLKKIGAPIEVEMGEADAFVQIVVDREGKRRIGFVINPLNYDDIETMRGVAEMAKDILIPQNWYKYEDINTIIMHEYGHVLDHYKSDYLISNSLKFETDLLKVIVKEDKSIKQLLGGYAESGLQIEGAMYGETWAELFKLYEYDKKLLTKDLIKLVEDMLKIKGG